MNAVIDQPQNVALTTNKVEGLLEDSKPWSVTEGGETFNLPSPDKVSEAYVAKIVRRARSLQSLDDLEMDLMRQRQAYRAIRKAAQKSKSALELQKNLEEQAYKSERLHAAHLGEALKLTRRLEVLAWQHFSFFAEAKISANDTQARGRIFLLPMDVEKLLAHPEFGKKILGSLSTKGNVHEDVFGMVVASGAIDLNEDIVSIGSVAGNHSALAFANITPSSLNHLDQLRKNKDGEENVVLTCVPIRVRRRSRYETEDVVIDGNFAAAGMEYYAQVNGLNNPRGNKQEFTLSDAYALSGRAEMGPLVLDFKDRYDQMPRNVLVGASATNPANEGSSNVNIYGNLTARGIHETYQISIRCSLNHLRRKLKIQGHRLLVPQAKRGGMIKTLQEELRFEFCGKEKPFATLALIEDVESEEAREILARGGVLVRAEVTMNGVPDFVMQVIIPIDKSIE
jgi:hypothetical protein